MPRACEFAGVRRPEVEVFAAVSRRGVDKTGSGVLSDMIAGEQRDGEVVASARPASGCAQTFPPGTPRVISLPRRNAATRAC